jgi:hypothetical protein
MAFPWMSVAKMGLGAIQTGVSAAKASNLPDPKEFEVTPELRKAYNMAFQETQQSWSPEDIAVFRQNQSRQTNAMKNMFRNFGMPAAGAAASGIMNIDATNAFAAQGAENRRQALSGFYGLSKDIQGVSNAETERFNQRLLQEETALGGATQMGISNIFGGLDSAANFMQTEDAISSLNKLGKTSGDGEDGEGGFNVDSLPKWLQKLGKNKGWFD